MRYLQARPQIRTGDLIAFRKRSGLLAWATRLITRSPYTHTAVAVWVNDSGIGRLLVAEAKASGSFLTPLSQYADEDFDVFACPVNPYICKKTIWSILGQPIRYDVMDLLRIAVNRLVGWPLPDADNDMLICSSLSASIYLKTGWSPSGLPSIPAPDDDVRALGGQPKITVRRGKQCH